MPILARLDAPGVYLLGIERRNIFRDDKNRNNRPWSHNFIDRLSDFLPDTQSTCHAWAFIPNHAHFLF